MNDAIFTAGIAIKQARFLIQTILDGFFDKYDPKNKEDGYAIRYDFERQQAFAVILAEKIQTIEDLLKAAEGVQEA